MNKLILSTGCLFHKPLGDTFLLAKKAGFDGIEVMVDNNPESLDTRKLNGFAEKFNIPVLSLHMPLDKCAVFGDDPQEIINSMVGIAQKLIVKNIVVHPARKTSSSYYNKLIDAINSKNNETTNAVYSSNGSEKLPTRNGIVFAVENLPDNGKYNKKVQNPVGLSQDFQDICLDTSHLATTSLDFKEVVSEAKNNIRHVHFSDSDILKKDGIVTDDHLPLVHGKLPLKWLVQLLINTGYKGMFCFELRPELFSGLSSTQITDLLKDIRSKYLSYNNKF